MSSQLCSQSPVACQRGRSTRSIFPVTMRSGAPCVKEINGVRHIPIGEVKLNMFNTPFFLNKSVLHLREGLHAMPSIQFAASTLRDGLCRTARSRNSQGGAEPLLNGLQTRGRTICASSRPQASKALWTKLPKHGIQFRPPWIHGFRQLHFLKHKLHRRVEQTRKSVTDTLFNSGRAAGRRKWCPLTIGRSRRGARLGRIWRSHDDDSNLGNRSSVDSTLGSTNRLGRSRSPSIFCLGTMY